MSDLMYAAMNREGLIDNRVLTGGSTTLATCSDLGTDYGTNDMKNAIMFVTGTTDGLAPINEFQRTTTLDTGTGAVTLAAALTVTLAAGDTVGFGKPSIPYLNMLQMVNDALRGLNEIELVDITMTTSAEKTEYTLPVGIKRRNLIKVEIETNDDTNDYQWREIIGCSVFPAASGTQSLLYIPQQDADQTIKLWYRGVHETLTAYNSVLNENIVPERAITLLIKKMQNWRYKKSLGGEPELAQFLNGAVSDANEAKALYPMRHTPRRPKIFTMSE